jgi:hypothetical protein
MIALSRMTAEFTFPAPSDALSRLLALRGKDWRVIHGVAHNGNITLEIETDSRLDIGLENRIKSKIDAVVKDQDITEGYTRLGKVLGLLGLLVVVSLSGCATAKGVKLERLTVTYKDVTVGVCLNNN